MLDSLNGEKKGARSSAAEHDSVKACEREREREKTNKWREGGRRGIKTPVVIFLLDMIVVRRPAIG
jgi:hypothetical protein